MSVLYCMTAGNEADRVEEDGLDGVFEKISREFLKEASLLPVGAECLKQSFNEGLAVLALHTDGHPVGYTRLQYLLASSHSLGEWLELGGTWVHPDYRGRGINETMYSLLLPRHKHRNILATTTNPISYKLGEKIGLVTVPRLTLPEPVWRGSCICPVRKTGSLDPDNRGCKFAWSEPQREFSPCWFRVTPETAERLGHNAR